MLKTYSRMKCGIGHDDVADHPPPGHLQRSIQARRDRIVGIGRQRGTRCGHCFVPFWFDISRIAPSVPHLRSASVLYRPIDPSTSSRRMSACPAWRAVSSSRCIRIQRRLTGVSESTGRALLVEIGPAHHLVHPGPHPAVPLGRLADSLGVTGVLVCKLGETPQHPAGLGVGDVVRQPQQRRTGADGRGGRIALAEVGQLPEKGFPLKLQQHHHGRPARRRRRRGGFWSPTPANGTAMRAPSRPTASPHRSPMILRADTGTSFKPSGPPGHKVGG